MRLRWKDFELPMGLECDTETLTDKHGFFSIEPFERGIGTTMGNSLRRLLLSSIQGSAVTSLRIPGIRCEFENLKGVLQDTSEIVMNIKSLCLRVHSDEPVNLVIEKDGPGEVHASDIHPHQDVEIINPDLLICTLSDGVKLNLEMSARKGRGFVLAKENMEKAKPVASDAFNVDSIFSPVQRVSHRVLGTRVGQRTDYEKLEIEIWTNGVISPRDALNEAATIMRKHIAPLLSYQVPQKVVKSEESPEAHDEESTRDLRDKLKLPISSLDPSARTRNCLDAENIKTIGQLMQLSEHDLLKFRNFGQTSLGEIKDKLTSLGLSLGMKVQS